MYPVEMGNSKYVFPNKRESCYPQARQLREKHLSLIKISKWIAFCIKKRLFLTAFYYHTIIQRNYYKCAKV